MTRVNNPEGRGLTDALNYVKSSATTSVFGSAGKQVSANEVNLAFARADQYMPEGKQVSTDSSLKIALALFRKDLTKSGIEAVFARFGINPEPIIEPDPDIIVRPRYGLMETARPIIDRVNAGTQTEEDVARLQLLKALADRASGGDVDEGRRPRGRAFAPHSAVRSLGGDSDGLGAARSAISEALAKC